GHRDLVEVDAAGGQWISIVDGTGRVRSDAFLQRATRHLDHPAHHRSPVGVDDGTEPGVPGRPDQPVRHVALSVLVAGQGDQLAVKTLDLERVLAGPHLDDLVGEVPAGTGCAGRHGKGEARGTVRRAARPAAVVRDDYRFGGHRGMRVSTVASGGQAKRTGAVGWVPSPADTCSQAFEPGQRCSPLAIRRSRPQLVTRAPAKGTHTWPPWV